MNELRWLAGVLRGALSEAENDLRSTGQLAGQYRQSLKRISLWESKEPARGGPSLFELVSSREWTGFVYELFDIVGSDSPAFEALVGWNRTLSEEADPD